MSKREKSDPSTTPDTMTHTAPASQPVETATTGTRKHSVGNSAVDETLYYPPPTSSYYFGPPDSSRAFGQQVTGKPGVHVPKEIVRIERDYSSGELPQFHSSFPLELEGRISPTTFSELINDINTLLIKAHNPRRTWIDNTFAILTFYISTLLFGSHHQRTMAELDSCIESCNRQTLHPAGLSLVNPRKTAFLFIELEYF
ncbi:uncharacterized protein UMAG_10511 [Mycosarcoma maydis]|uniref:Ras modification protein ERF4 n=1 Tax=Mycosarcoma maydis TaxID=5270 RepID=A0A0D1DVF7_MYCMD|nr:uncharacterized protein UMAG_10511 [Ustilago maydis 521]KIS68254.1 hypothetical protein UMAG_10511 [Ustilago maydis 521]|eukprot:XP_011390331.1 hypothetical protein UMAG_10511 [Ustilago maydis 521]